MPAQTLPLPDLKTADDTTATPDIGGTIRRLLVFLLVPLIVGLNRKWNLGLTDGDIQSMALAAAAYLLQSGWKAAKYLEAWVLAHLPRKP